MWLCGVLVGDVNVYLNPLANYDKWYYHIRATLETNLRQLTGVVHGVGDALA